jgi:ketosteroid isomerase-like protein
MSDPSERNAVADAVQRINRTWLEGRPNDMAPFLHPEIVMVLPDFNGHVAGRDSFIAGFVEFCAGAEMEEYGESDLQVDVTGDTAVASYLFDMIYERSGARYQAKGRDLWVFGRHDGTWLAVWRTILDMTEVLA